MEPDIAPIKIEVSIDKIENLSEGLDELLKVIDEIQEKHPNTIITLRVQKVNFPF